ncbi:MAG: glutathione S-transferase family protein [Gammaproteobacteria bacterium]|nr:glutathione S-transferase family protein [Gammaproteobacteria bacterium]
MLKVWGRRSSSNVQALMWCIGELELDYERTDAGFTYGLVNTPEYLDMNPNATVPTVMDDDGPPLWETGAICRYLASRYGDAQFWPDDPRQRVLVDRWAEWAKINIAHNFTSPVFWRVARTAPSKRDLPAIDEALARLHQFLAIADATLASSRYLAGEHFTLADIQFGHSLYRYYDIEIARAPLANLARYYETLRSRPAFREHVMVSYEELRVVD